MNHYIDITIKPDSEMRISFLLNKVFTNLHRLLSRINSTQIGLSFPKYTVTLGDVIRIHGTKESLNEIQGRDWIGGLLQYCHITNVLTVPTSARYRTVSRKQANMSHAKLNRLLARGTIAPDQAQAYKAKMFQNGLSNPFLELESASNGHRHRRYLSFGDITDHPTLGTFDQFGLSKHGSIPWF